MIAGVSCFDQMHALEKWTKLTMTRVQYLLAVTYDMFCFSVVHLLWPPSCYMIDGFGGKHNSICVDLHHNRMLCDQSLHARLRGWQQQTQHTLQQVYNILTSCSDNLRHNLSNCGDWISFNMLFCVIFIRSDVSQHLHAT